MYIIIYWSKGMPRRYAVMFKNEDTLMVGTKKQMKELAETLKKGEHENQKPKKNCKICKGTGEMGRQGFPCDCNWYWARLKGFEYKLVKI